MLVLKNSDIVSALPILADMHEKADSGSTTTLVANTLVSLTEEEVVGATLCILNGSLKNTDIVITAFNDATGTITFATQSSAIDSSTVFALVYKPYDSFITRAEEIISNQFRNTNKDLALFLTTSQIKELHLLKTLEIICLSKRQNANSDDMFHINYEDFKSSYSNEVLTLKADYDVDEDGTIEEDEEEKITHQVRLKK